MDINSHFNCRWQARTISILEDTQPWLSDIYRPLRRASPGTSSFQQRNTAGAIPDSDSQWEREASLKHIFPHKQECEVTLC